jgi:DNA recombination protein RmuC
VEIAAVVLSILTLMAVIVLIIRNRPKPDQSLVLLQNQLNAVQARLDKFGQIVSENVQASTASMNARLDNTANVIADLREKVGQIHEVGKAAAELVNILRAPRLRGGMGELFLGDLLAQVLPPEHYRVQYRFKSGEAVDAAVQIGQQFVPVDAKFPLENFRRVLEAPTESERVASRKQFLRDVKKHVDAIAGKYIRPDEGTFDFALMYVPAENVYYETIIKDDSDSEHQLFGYALQKKVIPVSPNSFYAYLQTILLGLRGMKVEHKAQEILAALGGLRGDFEKLQENFRVLGRHITNANSCYGETDKAISKFDAKLSQVEQPQLPPVS